MRLPGSVDAARRFRSAIGMAVAGLLLAGCATVDVTPPPTILPSIVVATPAQVAPTTSPAPDASPVAPTPSPSPTRSPELTTLPLLAALPQVKVVTCHTLDAGGGSPGKPPKTVHLRVAADMATKLAVYFITDGYYVVGPAGWRCTAEIFGDGGATIAIRSRTDGQAVVSFASTVSYYDVLEWACSVDKRAATALRREFSGACPKSPKGQRLKRVCGESVTPGGVFKVYRKEKDWWEIPLGKVYNPIYFNGGIAIHGYQDVPFKPASHGCIRVPMHIAEYLPDLLTYQSDVFVWDGVKEPEDYGAQKAPPDKPDPTDT